MKRLLLTSHGVTNQRIANALSDLVGKPLNEISIAVIVEAIFKRPYANKAWFIEELYQMEQFLGGRSAKIDFVSLSGSTHEEIIARLSAVDVIYVVGAGQMILPEIFTRTGFDKILRDKLLDEKVYMGSSAGSMMLTKLVRNSEFIKTTFSYKHGSEEEYLAQKVMEIVNFGFIPHLNRPDHPFNAGDMARILADNPFPVYGVEDSQAVVVNGDNISFVGDGDIQTFGM